LKIEFPAKASDKQPGSAGIPPAGLFCNTPARRQRSRKLQILNRQFLLQSAQIDFILKA
jgi:hypothetical protein